MAIPRRDIPTPPPVPGTVQQTAPQAAPPPVPPTPPAAPQKYQEQVRQEAVPQPEAPVYQPAAPSQVPYTLVENEIPFSDAHQTAEVPFEVETEDALQGAMAVQPATSRNLSMGATGNVLQQAEQYGYTGLDLNAFGVLPVISLKNEKFQTGDGALVFGESFLCRSLGGAPKYVYKTDLSEKDPRSDIFYTYDNEYVSGSGQLVKAKLAEWQSANIPFVRRDYRDLRIGVIKDGAPQDDMMLAILSIPPTSVSNYTNIILQLMQWANLTSRDPSERVIKVWKGPLVTKVRFPFYPIKFTLIPLSESAF